MSEEEPKSETVLHFRDFGVSVAELSDEDVDKVTRDSRVVEVVEDEWVYPHSD